LKVTPAIPGEQIIGRGLERRGGYQWHNYLVTTEFLRPRELDFNMQER
jgi:hypothetical protein